MSSPTNPDLYTPIRYWLSANIGAYAAFRRWLRAAGYSESALNIYSCAVRLAISQLDKPYWQISDADLDEVRVLIADCFPSEGTRQSYHKGLLKLAEWLRQRQGKPQPTKPTNWDYFLAGIPPEITTLIQRYIRHCQRNWLAEKQQRLTDHLVGTLTRFLRWAVAEAPVKTVADLNPTLWFGYLDARLAAGIGAATLNRELFCLQSWLRYLQEQEIPICERLLRVERLKEGPKLPKDVSVAQLQQVAAEIEREAVSSHLGLRRCGVMDRAWWRLMLCSGLRVGEVRRLRQS
ncbi:MAG: hypothetical protein KDD89_10920, partial [Anaerolineales bacterium]|nr:hypothetical protein [Anaerolineales bacterium]